MLCSLVGWEYTFLGVSQALRTALGFASPVAVNQLLKYIEERGEGAVVRPWYVDYFVFGPSVSYTPILGFGSSCYCFPHCLHLS